MIPAEITSPLAGGKMLASWGADVSRAVNAHGAELQGLRRPGKWGSERAESWTDPVPFEVRRLWVSESGGSGKVAKWCIFLPSNSLYIAQSAVDATDGLTAAGGAPADWYELPAAPEEEGDLTAHLHVTLPYSEESGSGTVEHDAEAEIVTEAETPGEHDMYIALAVIGDGGVAQRVVGALVIGGSAEDGKDGKDAGLKIETEEAPTSEDGRNGVKITLTSTLDGVEQTEEAKEFTLYNGADGDDSTVPGPQGVGVGSVELKSEDSPNRTKTYAVKSNEATPRELGTFTVKDGADGDDSTVPGPQGVGIANIASGTATSSAGYTTTPVTVTLTNNTTKSFNVKAKDGEDASVANVDVVVGASFAFNATTGQLEATLARKNSRTRNDATSLVVPMPLWKADVDSGSAYSEITNKFTKVVMPGVRTVETAPTATTDVFEAVSHDDEYGDHSGTSGTGN